MAAVFYNLAHNTPEWYAARIGASTASMFDKIITPLGKPAFDKNGKPAQKAEEYANRILAEMIMGTNLEVFKQSYWMERGQIEEANARTSYEFLTGFTLDRGGFFLNEEMMAGASPDVRCFENGNLVGGAEIKCPAPWTHVANLRRMHETGAIDPDYIPQVQGQICIMGVEWIDWFSYHPDMPQAMIRTERDEGFQTVLVDALFMFADLLKATADKLRDNGVTFKDLPRPDPFPIDHIEDAIAGPAEYNLPS